MKKEKRKWYNIRQKSPDVIDKSECKKIVNRYESSET